MEDKTELIILVKIIYWENETAVELACSILNNGGVIVYPTDTLYGFGCDAKNESAIEKINALKGRKAPMSVLAPNRKIAAKWMNISQNDKNIVLKKLNLEKFLQEVEKFEYLKKKEFFVPNLPDDKSFFEYDIIKFLNKDIRLNDFGKKINQNIKFYRKDSSNKIIKRGSEVFGTTYAGIYKQITRTNISKLYRECDYE